MIDTTVDKRQDCVHWIGGVERRIIEGNTYIVAVEHNISARTQFAVDRADQRDIFYIYIK